MTVALLASLIAGCAASPAPSAAPPTATETPPSPGSATGSPSASPAAPMPTASLPPRTPAPTRTPAPAAPAPLSCASRVFATMSESQRIGQLFIIGLTRDHLDAAERTAVAQFHFGSVSFTAKTSAGVAAVRAIVDAVQAEATPTATGRVKFLVAANQEGGLIQALSGPGFDVMPSALSQGTLAPADLERMAARWGRELRAAGINLDFAPVADVVPPGTDAGNAPIGQLEREYGHDPATVSSHVAAFIRGMEEAGVATSAKHFPGLGRVAGNTDFTAAVTDLITTRHDPFLQPFAGAIHAGVPFVMISLATYERIDPRHLAAFSPAVMTGMLRVDLGYRGLVISDALGAAAVASIPPATRALDFVGAGGDMIVVNQLVPAVQMAQALASAAAQGPGFRDRVNDAVLRVLRTKEAMGLLPCDA